MKRLFLLTAILLFSFQSEAISTRFKFYVHSSGPDIYPCNAGIMAQDRDGSVCRNSLTGETCLPDTCSTAEANCQSSCVCSGANGGGYLMNYGLAKYRDRKDHGDYSTSGAGTGTFRGTSTSTFAKLFSDSQSWAKELTYLEFNLGSELYSAKYFVDICYKNSQLPYRRDNISALFSVKADVAGVNFIQTNERNNFVNNRDGLQIPATTLRYLEQAGVQVQTFVACDFQGVGQYTGQGNASGVTNTLDNEAGFTYASNGNPNGSVEPGSFFLGDARPLVGSVAVQSIREELSNSSKVPRFCKVRHIFTETNFNSSDAQLRRWKLHGAEMCTYTAIEEDAQEQELGIIE